MHNQDEPAEPVLVTILWMDHHEGLPSIALVLPEGTRAPCLHIVDPEDVSTFSVLLETMTETFVSSTELFPYRWFQRLLERPTGPCVALERVL